MYQSGYHYTASEGDVGYEVPGHVLIRGLSLAPAKSTAGWRLSEPVPHRGHQDARFWFSYAEMSHLMMTSESDVRVVARQQKWRSRYHNTTKMRQFYLLDVLVTRWQHCLRWEGNTLDAELVEEARNRASELGVL